MNKADLVDRIAGACNIGQGVGDDRDRHRRGQCYRCPQRGDTGRVDRFRHILSVTEEGSKRTQSADRSNY